MGFEIDYDGDDSDQCSDYESEGSDDSEGDWNDFMETMSDCEDDDRYAFVDDGD